MPAEQRSFKLYCFHLFGKSHFVFMFAGMRWMDIQVDKLEAGTLTQIVVQQLQMQRNISDSKRYFSLKHFNLH